MKLKLSYRTREKGTKSALSAVRREGDIPASIYIKGQASEAIAIKEAEFSAILREMPQGRLPTTVFALQSADGKERLAVIKDIQYQVTNYQVLHLDFEELLEKEQVRVKVPIELTGTAECVGVKLGGAIRQVIRHVQVRCFPKDLPTSLSVDVRELGARQSRRIQDIAMPPTLKTLANPREVVVAIVKR